MPETIRGSSVRLTRLDAAGHPIPGTETELLGAGSVELEDDEWEIGAFRWNPVVWMHPLLSEDMELIDWIRVQPGGPEMRSHP